LSPCTGHGTAWKNVDGGVGRGRREETGEP
jgi:hypothetical protein